MSFSEQLVIVLELVENADVSSASEFFRREADCFAFLLLLLLVELAEEALTWSLLLLAADALFLLLLLLLFHILFLFAFEFVDLCKAYRRISIEPLLQSLITVLYAGVTWCSTNLSLLPRCGLSIGVLLGRL